MASSPVSFDQSYIEPYLSDWLKGLIECNKAEMQLIDDNQEFYVPFGGVGKKVLNLIFNICRNFEIEPHAKFMAIHILDRYWSKLFWEYLSSYLSPLSESSTTINIPESTLRLVREKMKDQLIIALTVCIQIASKVETSLGLPDALKFLQTIDKKREYGNGAIWSYELRILKTLDFRLPQCLPVQAIELFLAYVELDTKPGMSETCFHLLDVAYLCHDVIFEQLVIVSKGQRYDKSDPKDSVYLRLEANAVFLAAVVVVCAVFFHLMKRKFAKVSSQLARLIDMEAHDIMLTAEILHNHVIQDKDYEDLKEHLSR